MSFTLPGYAILRESSRDRTHTIYRGIREKDQTPVLIKTLSISHPKLDDVARIKNEYELLKSLDLPSIVKAYALERHQNGYQLILEDTNAITLDKWFKTKSPELSQKMILSIHIVQALGDLQAEDIIHKDIQPENILVYPDSLKVKLTGFNYATKIPKQRLTFKKPALLEGSLPYMSPEQTGRMNQELDYRTDFYSLGVTFYKLFTHQLPFATNDPMELVHAHIAKTPTAPYEVDPAIPVPLSNIIVKLMSKKPEERYSSTFSLLNDLERCLKEYQQKGTVEPFPLGENDLYHRIQISHKLYGREKEIEVMMGIFQQISKGSSELLLLSGYPGIGKSSIVNELKHSIVENRGFFISGKHDQYKTNIPYSGFIEAFQSLVLQILTESDDTINMWREKIKEALGSNADVVLEVIPELSMIIGEGTFTQEYDSQETQNRFNFFLQRFISLYASEDFPLVIFLDDLQWIDPASLQLLELILTTLKTSGLLIIGAYRNNEVTSIHPLISATQRIKRHGSPVTTLEVPPLKIESVEHLIADSLHLPQERCKELTKVVYEKTQGNPFFINQLLTLLYEEKLLYVDQDLGIWTWNSEKIRSFEVSGNVIDLLISKLQKCSSEMQEILEAGACIGSSFDARLISTIKEMPLSSLISWLMEAIREGLILPSDNFIEGEEEGSSKTFRFLHDKVQQAAYLLMNEDKRKLTHYKIGLILLKKYSSEELEDNIFEVMSQLNHAQGLITEKNERIQYAGMNLIAAEKAMRTVAWGTAIEFLTDGLAFLPENKWETHYSTTFKMHLLLAEARFLLYDFDTASRLFDQVLSYSKSISDKISVHVLKIKLSISSVDYKEAVIWGRNALKLLDTNLPSTHLKAHALKEYLILRFNLLGKNTESLASLPTITDPKAFDIIRILVLLIPPAYFTSKELFAFVVMKGLNLILKYGNAPMTAYLYASYGIILNAVFEDFKGSFEFGKLALEINRKYEDKQYIPATKFLVGTFLNSTQRHLRTSIDILQQGYEMGTSTGDFINAAFCQGMLMNFKFLIGTNLSELQQEVSECLKYVTTIKSHNRGYFFYALRQIIMALQGQTPSPSSMETNTFQEEPFYQMLQENNFLITLYIVYTLKMGICYLFEDYEKAIEIGKRSSPLAYVALGQPIRLVNEYYFALGLIGNYPHKDKSTQIEFFKEIEKISKKLKPWAKAAPSNYLQKSLIIQAELERIKGNKEKATELYDQAIELAKENGYHQDEGIANELFAKFYLAQNRPRLAKQYLIDSHYAFYKWGAPAKQKQLEAKYKGLLPEDASKAYSDSALPASESDTAPALDQMAVIKAAQTISGQIVFDQLLEQLLRIVIEAAGAERAILILEQDEKWIIEAEYSTKLGTVNRPLVPYKDKANEISCTIIQFVIRTKEQVVLDDASNQNLFINDPYITQKKPKSILCFPLQHQVKLPIGVLYLENNLTTKAFTQSRVEVLKHLTTQIAIAIENSLLYSHQAKLTEELSATNEKLEDYSQNLEKKVYDRTRELNEKNKELEETLQQIKEMQKRLMEQEKLVSKIAVTKSVATEMRNPLNYIDNFASLTENLLQEIPKTPTDKEVLELIRSNLIKIREHSKKADEIIASMVAQSSDSGQEKELTDINKLIRDYADLVYYSYYKKDPLFSLTIETEYDSSLDKILVYPQHLGRVIYNIIDNACYATDLKKKKVNGTYSPVVSILTKNEEESVIIKIRDNGIGIPLDILSKVFSPFLSTKSTSQNAGMGLSISHDIIVQDHGGTIAVDSEEGLYTEVTISLPKF